VTFNVHDWEKVGNSIYRNRHTLLNKSKITFSLQQQAELELRDFIFVHSGVLLIQEYLNNTD
jgi:hypothetical protein